jgi:hypothetical protein
MGPGDGGKPGAGFWSPGWKRASGLRKVLTNLFSIILNAVKDMEHVEMTGTHFKTYFIVILNAVKDLELAENTRFFASLRMTMWVNLRF